MNLLSLSQEEQVFAARVQDAVFSACRKNKCKQIGFLDERQRMIAEAVCRRERFDRFRFWGGYPEAVRVLLACFPDYLDPDEAGEMWELTALTFSFRPADKLTHRDFLGALMALGIKRETVGDILTGDGICVLFALPTAAQLILNEVSKIGRAGVKVSEGLPEELPLQQRLLPREGTVASARLDAIVAFLTGSGREKAQQMIGRGLVALDCEAVTDIARTVEPGSRISVRGYGRFILEQFGGVTKKGRLHVKASQYQ